ncbi:MAG: hypothetical protein ABIK65_15785 [Candidatus Eisenbacteria bacterium]
MTRVSTIAMFALLLVAAGCGKRPEPVRVSSDGIDTPRPGATPIEVMENIALAHASRDIDLYREQFDPRFEIRFPSEQECWNAGSKSDFEKEMESTGGILGASGWVDYSVSCDPPRPSHVDGYPASAGFQEVMVRDFHVSFWIAGTEDTFTVTDDSALYVFSPDSSAGTGRWKIIFQRLFVGGGDACAAPPIEE